MFQIILFSIDNHNFDSVVYHWWMQTLEQQESTYIELHGSLEKVYLLLT